MSCQSYGAVQSHSPQFWSVLDTFVGPAMQDVAVIEDGVSRLELNQELTRQIGFVGISIPFRFCTNPLVAARDDNE